MEASYSNEILDCIPFNKLSPNDSKMSNDSLEAYRNNFFNIFIIFMSKLFKIQLSFTIYTEKLKYNENLTKVSLP
jgi:hypothetical protein